MSPRSKKTSLLMRARTREAILAASLELFAKHGFSATTTEQIARKAGISKGLIFTQFRRKQDILLAIFERMIDKVMPSFLLQRDARPPKEKLQTLVTTWLKLIETEPLAVRLTLQLNLDDAYRRIVRSKKWKQYADDMTRQLKSILKELGSNNPEFDTYLLMFLFDGIVANYTVAPEMFPPIDTLAGYMVRMLTTRWDKAPT
ncbi:MAG TPA: helix-turn-helix domain-containing protein [Bacteroidota bacterium]|nr:helix-turn-helix domain-containing protein [Bacteroidota bacterium]